MRWSTLLLAVWVYPNLNMSWSICHFFSKSALIDGYAFVKYAIIPLSTLLLYHSGQSLTDPDALDYFDCVYLNLIICLVQFVAITSGISPSIAVIVTQMDPRHPP